MSYEDLKDYLSDKAGASSSEPSNVESLEDVRKKIMKQNDRHGINVTFTEKDINEDIKPKLDPIYDKERVFDDKIQ